MSGIEANQGEVNEHPISHNGNGRLVRSREYIVETYFSDEGIGGLQDKYGLPAETIHAIVDPVHALYAANPDKLLPGATDLFLTARLGNAQQRLINGPVTVNDYTPEIDRYPTPSPRISERVGEIVRNTGRRLSILWRSDK